MKQYSADSPPLGLMIGEIAAEMKNASSGDLAQLRRLDPDSPGGSAFWRIVVTQLESETSAVGAAHTMALRRWAVILRMIAELDGLHDPQKRFGTALAKADISDMRFNRLLRARDPHLFDELRAITHRLSSAAASADLTDAARLVLSDGGNTEQQVRQKIANDYYDEIYRPKKENK